MKNPPHRERTATRAERDRALHAVYLGGTPRAPIAGMPSTRPRTSTMSETLTSRRDRVTTALANLNAAQAALEIALEQVGHVLAPGHDAHAQVALALVETRRAVAKMQIVHKRTPA